LQKPAKIKSDAHKLTANRVLAIKVIKVFFDYVSGMRTTVVFDWSGLSGDRGAFHSPKLVSCKILGGRGGGKGLIDTPPSLSH